MVLAMKWARFLWVSGQLSPKWAVSSHPNRLRVLPRMGDPENVKVVLRLAFWRFREARRKSTFSLPLNECKRDEGTGLVGVAPSNHSCVAFEMCLCVRVCLCVCIPFWLCVCVCAFLRDLFPGAGGRGGTILKKGGDQGFAG